MNSQAEEEKETEDVCIFLDEKDEVHFTRARVCQSAMEDLYTQVMFLL